MKKKNPNRYPYSTNKLYINQDQYTKSLFLNTLNAICKDTIRGGP